MRFHSNIPAEDPCRIFASGIALPPGREEENAMVRESIDDTYDRCLRFYLFHRVSGRAVYYERARKALVVVCRTGLEIGRYDTT